MKIIELDYMIGEFYDIGKRFTKVIIKISFINKIFNIKNKKIQYKIKTFNLILFQLKKVKSEKIWGSEIMIKNL